MSIVLSENHYGKSGVRLVKVERHGARHDMSELRVDIQLRGDFAASYEAGDNRLVVAGGGRGVPNDFLVILGAGDERVEI